MVRIPVQPHRLHASLLPFIICNSVFFTGRETQHPLSTIDLLIGPVLENTYSSFRNDNPFSYENKFIKNKFINKNTMFVYRSFYQ